MTVDTQVHDEAVSHVSGSKNFAPSTKRPIIDIRRDREEFDLRSDIYSGLKPKNGDPKRLPTLLLYDEIGLKLFEDITYLQEYYPTNTEIEVLEAHSNEIAQSIEPGSILLELGSGNLRKVDILLRAIDRAGKSVDYYALDLSLAELERTLAEIPDGAYTHVRCYGLHGTYDDGLEWLKTPLVKSKPKLVLSLGSSIGNFERPDAAEFIRGFAEVIRPEDNILIAIDGCTDPDRVFHAYNDRDGVTHNFISNGLKNANRICGKQIFDLDAWRVTGEFNKEAGCHQAFVSPTRDTDVDGIPVRKGEKLKIEESHKYSDAELLKLWHSAAVKEKVQWANQRRDYALHMISKDSFAFPTNPERYASSPVPSWPEWAHLWSLWDAVTRRMIPDEELLDKPIKLRNACIFYLGHIPTFFDMKLSDVTDGVATEPASFRNIFERGIDPDVDNPEHCHAHSEIPSTWPPLEEILTFQSRVRDRVKRLYDSDSVLGNPKVARALWLGYEHECMHLETLLYMLIQSEKTLPPPGVPVPDFKALAQKADAASVPNAWITVPENDIVIGLDDPETASGPTRYFGWDVEKPPQKAHVPAFAAKARPITIGEYAQYLQDTGKTQIPASWSEDLASNGHVNGTNGFTNGHGNGITNGYGNGVTSGHGISTNGHENGARTNGNATKPSIVNRSVRSVYGLIPLAQALHWPVAASYDELSGCAAWMGGRIPTLEEAQSIYSYVDNAKKAGSDNFTQKTIPAVNSQMVNNGVEESPPSERLASGATTAHASNGHDGGAMHISGKSHSAPAPSDIFVDLGDCNTGFQQWVPIAVTQNGGRLSGRADMGGVWEWTSTTLKKEEGFEPMPMYPAFSQDFFDDKHNIVLGGSWATAPRLAGRKTFINWYQRNYPYVWAGARVVRDL